MSAPEWVGWFVGLCIGAAVSVAATLAFSLDDGAALLVGLVAGWGFSMLGLLVGSEW